MYNNIWSKYEALSRILGISKKEIACLCGSSEEITVQLSEAQISKRAIRTFDKIMAQFDPHVQETIFKLRDALMTTNYKSITAKKRFTSIGNLLIALGFTQTEFAKIMKTNEGMISKVVNNTKDMNDELAEKMRNWLNARYSVLSSTDKEKVDLLKTALDIVGSVKTNPYRKHLIEIGALGTLPKPVESTKEVEDLKEYIKLLEEENETLRKENAHINPDYISLLEKDNDSLRRRLEELEEELETERDNSLYAQRELNEANQKVDELEAKIFRLEEEKEALIGMNENIGNGVSPFKFENCIVNIYTKEDI